MPVQFYQDSAINVVMTLGYNKMIGGSTDFFVSVSKCDAGNLITKILFINGRILIGNTNKVLHGVKFLNRSF